MWLYWYKRWLELCCWWLPKPGEEEAADKPPMSSPATHDDASSETTADEHDASPSAKERHVEDLTVIKGIGPAVQTKLRDRGIACFADLAAADADELTRELKSSQPISTERVRRWIEAARERAGADA